MSVIFHLASALGLVLVTYLLFQAQRQRDFLRELLLTQRRHRAPVKVHVEAPTAFLTRFAAAVGVPFEAVHPAATPPVRIAAAPLIDLFLQGGLTLIRCQDRRVEVHLSQAPAEAELAARLSAALGGGVEVTVISGSASASRGQA